jgi:hypothetical protein
MHGSRHRVTETLDDHVNGRCTAIPIVKGHDPNIPTGEELFKDLPPAQQRSILGPAAHEAWLDGRVSLAPDGRNSVVGQRNDPRWGTMRYARSLQEIVGQRDAKDYVSLALREAKLSPNETDRLVRRLIRSGRVATAQEVEQIAGRVAQAPFNTGLVLSGDEANVEYLGRTTKDRDDAGWVHLVKRVETEKQWRNGTSLNEYVSDLQRVAINAEKIAVYRRRGGSIVLLWARTDEVIAEDHKGLNAKSEIITIYSADRGMIITGYQIKHISEVSLGENLQWLRQ